MLYWRLRIQRQIKQIFVIKEYVLMSIDAIIAKLGGRSSSLAMIFLATLLYTQLAMAFLATLLHAHKGGQVHGFLCYWELLPNSLNSILSMCNSAALEGVTKGFLEDETFERA